MALAGLLDGKTKPGGIALPGKGAAAAVLNGDALSGGADAGADGTVSSGAAADATVPCGVCPLRSGVVHLSHKSDVHVSGSGRVHSAQRFFLRSASTFSRPHWLPPAPMSQFEATGLDLGARLSCWR